MGYIVQNVDVIVGAKAHYEMFTTHYFTVQIVQRIGKYCSTLILIETNIIFCLFPELDRMFDDIECTDVW